MKLLEHDLINAGIATGGSGRLPLPKRQPKITPLPPWEAYRWRLLSLAEMLEPHAKAMLSILDALTALERNRKQIRELQEQFREGLSDEGKEIVRGLVNNESAALNRTLEIFAKYAQLMGLQSVPAQIERIRNDIPNPTVANELIEQNIRELRQRIEDELKTFLFLHVASSNAKYYSEQNLFGEGVARKLPQVTEDIAESGKCFALGRFTATVFHLMRVMEAGVARLAAMLNATINLDRPWGAILVDIDAAIRVLPGARATASKREKTRHAKLHEIACYLHHVKDAWRNATMHPKRTYTEEEAKHLIDNVKTFMQSLVKIR